MLRGLTANRGFSRICWAIGVVAAAAGLGAAGLAATPSARAAVAGGEDCTSIEWPAVAGQRDSAIAAGEAGARAQADAAGGVTLAFLPGPVRSPLPLLLRDLEPLPGFALGLTSPTLGRYSPAQEVLDVSQGSRVASTLYSPAVPAIPGLAVNRESGAGRIVGWRDLRRRAADVPGEIVPGLLAQTLIDAGEPVAYVGYGGGSNLPAIAAAAAPCGVVQAVSSGPQSTLAERAGRAAAAPGLTVVSLPAGGFGLGVVRRLTEANPDRVVIVMQAPPEPARNRLLAIAVYGLAGGEGEGGMKSPTTRRGGLVAATDVAPTILKELGVKAPASMEGRPIEPAPRSDSAALQSMSNRLSLIQARRQSFGKAAVTMLLLVLLGVLALSKLSGDFEAQARFAMRLVALTMLWLPLLLLLTAALRPSGQVELDITVAGSMVLALITDRLVRWPRAPIVPVVVVLCAYTLDFAIGGSNLTGQSLLGSNPFYGARFFGAGNELEATFVVTALIGVGSLLCWWRFARPGIVFGLLGVALAMFLGIGKLGADVGGVIMVAGGFGVAALHASRRKLSFKNLALLVALPVVGLAVIAVIDHFTGGQSHLSRTVLRAESAGDLVDVAVRRFTASVDGAMVDRVWVLVIVAAALLAWAWWRRERLFAPLYENGSEFRPLESGLLGGLAATLVGALANDSGPAILLIGTVYLGVGAIYVRGRPHPVAEVASQDSPQSVSGAIPAQ